MSPEVKNSGPHLTMAKIFGTQKIKYLSIISSSLIILVKLEKD